jgi:hypothetical protein
MFPGGRNGSNSNSRNRNGYRYRGRKNRKRSSSPASLLLLNGNESCCDDDENENENDHLEQDCDFLSSRPSPIPWTSDLHMEFVKAVFQIGIEESSPAVIAEQMITKNSYNQPEHQYAVEPAPGDNKNHDGAVVGNNHERSSSSSVLPNSNTNSAVAMAAVLAIIGKRDTARGKPPNQQSQSESATEETSCKYKSSDDLPGEAEYYKRELTGERLKSHLQKMRKQKVREKEVFLEDYKRVLARKQALDKERKEVEKLEKKRKEEARSRRKLKRKRSQKPSMLLDASAFDHLDDLERSMAAMGGAGNGNGTNTTSSGTSGGHDSSDEDIHEDVSKEEEERLLSMYLPLRSSAIGQNYDLNLGLEYDPNHELFDETTNSHLCAFPVGGRAIGMVTWAVQQQEIEDRTKRKQKQKQRKLQQRNLPSYNGWEIASVDSWTSNTAIAAGKLATALGPHGRRGAPSDHHRHHPSSLHEKNEAGESTTCDSDSDSDRNRQRIVIDCASSEDDHTEHGDLEDDNGEDDDDDDDQFVASIPTLTEAEKTSPLGVSMRLTCDMIKHMHGVIAEERASKQQQQQQQQHQKANAAQKQQQRTSTEGSSPVNEKPPPVSRAAELHLLEQPKLPSNAGFSRKNNSDRSEAKRIVPLEVIHHCHDGRNYNNDPAQTAVAWNPATTANNTSTNTNSHLLAAIAANGPPPSNLVATALANALLGGNLNLTVADAFMPEATVATALDNVFLGENLTLAEAGAFMPEATKAPPSLVTPPHPLVLENAELQRFPEHVLHPKQYQLYQLFRQQQQHQQQQDVYKGWPMHPPMGVLPSFPYPMGLPQSPSQTSSPCLWTPTNATDAMFRSLQQQQRIQQQKQQQQQKNPV